MPRPGRTRPGPASKGCPAAGRRVAAPLRRPGPLRARRRRSATGPDRAEPSRPHRVGRAAAPAGASRHDRGSRHRACRRIRRPSRRAGDRTCAVRRRVRRHGSTRGRRVRAARPISPRAVRPSADGATHLGEQRVLLRARKLEGRLAPGDDLVSEPEQHVVMQSAGEAQRQVHVRRSNQPLMGRTKIAQFPVDDRDPRAPRPARVARGRPVRRPMRSGWRASGARCRLHRGR